MPKISEEQRQAQLGYLDRTLRPMAVGNPQQQYDATLNAIRKGFTIFEHRARELAEKHGIDITGLPKAINDGERRLLGMYVDAITEKEGHSAFATKKEADDEAFEILDYYAEVYEKLLAIPVLKGKKSESEKFAGADYTLSVEALLPNGKAIQGATSHHLGQNFSKSFNISFLDDSGKSQFVYQNSWGITTRSIGVAVMMHSDDKGLVLPPFVAENKLVIVPILGDKDPNVMKKCKELEKVLKEFNPILDDRSGYSPGWKFNEWELKGIPLRVELGPKDLEKDHVVLAYRHDGKKEFIKTKDLKSKISEALNSMHNDLLAKAKLYLKENIVDVNSLKDFEKVLKDKKVAHLDWCNTAVCEKTIKDKFDGAKSLNLEFDSKPKSKKCIICGKDSSCVAYIGKSY